MSRELENIRLGLDALHQYKSHFEIEVLYNTLRNTSDFDVFLDLLRKVYEPHDFKVNLLGNNCNLVVGVKNEKFEGKLIAVACSFISSEETIRCLTMDKDSKIGFIDLNKETSPTIKWDITDLNVENPGL